MFTPVIGKSEARSFLKQEYIRYLMIKRLITHLTRKEYVALHASLS